MEAGHQVLGLSLRLGQGADQAPEAGAVAARQLGIEHRVVEAGSLFADRVVDPTARAYARGITPNPCVLCNAGVKLPLLWQAARRLGCEALATGHYARLRDTPAGPVLLEGADPRKSQSYFLARVPGGLLAHLVFPLGEHRKDQVRELARRGWPPERPEAYVCILPPTVDGPGRDVWCPGHGRRFRRSWAARRRTFHEERRGWWPWATPLWLALDGRRRREVGPRGFRPAWWAAIPGNLPSARSQAPVRIRYAHRGWLPCGGAPRLEVFSRPAGGGWAWRFFTRAEARLVEAPFS